MSINDKFTYLQQTKEKIKTAIQNKGVDVSDADTFRSYAEKIALIEGGGSGGDTTWAYHTGQAVVGDKVMLTKVNSLVTPDDAFCNGFRPCLIFNGYVYGTVGDYQYPYFNARRQIVNGVIDSSVTDTVPTTNQPNASFLGTNYALNGASAIEVVGTSLSSTAGVRLTFGTTFINLGNINRTFICENAILYCPNGDSTAQIIDCATGTKTSWRPSNMAIGFEDGIGNDFYMIYRLNNYNQLYKFTKSTGVSELVGTANVVINTSATLTATTQHFFQTKDYKYLIHLAGYVDLDIENNTFTFNDYPAVILNEIGDRTIYCMQVFYDGYFSIQLSDGTTLMCKYTNSMEDVEIKEIVEPIIIDGDETIYQRHFSPDRMYWVNRPVKGPIAVPLANNPAGPYKAKEATSDYIAYKPSKDRFNSTVLSGFLTGETKDEDGRQMVEVKTALGI